MFYQLIYYRKRNLPLKKSNGYAIKENGMGREENVTVFKDTEKQVKSNNKLKNISQRLEIILYLISKGNLYF